MAEYNYQCYKCCFRRTKRKLDLPAAMCRYRRFPVTVYITERVIFKTRITTTWAVVCWQYVSAAI